MIEIKNITKVYGKKKNTFTALKDVSLAIEEGSSVAVLGKSGSGKSTLMHAISGLDKPQQGEVVINGEDILRLKRKATDRFRARTMGFIFQSFFVEGGESCYDNVSLSLETAGVPRSQRKRRIVANPQVTSTQRPLRWWKTCSSITLRSMVRRSSSSHTTRIWRSAASASFVSKMGRLITTALWMIRQQPLPRLKKRQLVAQPKPQHLPRSLRKQRKKPRAPPQKPNPQPPSQHQGGQTNHEDD